ncbi:MAG: pilus assembly protein PilM [Anaerolineae bacterium]|nr:pilus assembly protein PilM [Phycisphaerae bacterium]
MAITMANILRPLQRTARAGPIGLDVGSQHVRAVQLARGADGAWSMRASASFPRTAECQGKALSTAEAHRIGDVLFRRNFVGTELVLAVPDEKLLTTNLELPPRTRDIPLDEIARVEFARSLKVESESLEFDYWDLPAPARAGKATHVMGVGCRHADCEPIIDAFESAGFDLRAIEVEACALTRACFAISAPPNEITAIADIGWRAVRLFVVHQGVVSYQRSLAGFGMERLHNALADQFEVRGGGSDVVDEVLRRVTLGDVAGNRESDLAAANPEARRVLRSHFDSVAAEVITSLSYTSHQYPDAPVSRLVICGGGASLSGLPEYLNAQLKMSTVSAKAGDLLRVGDATMANDPSMTLAIGLALNDGDATGGGRK